MELRVSSFGLSANSQGNWHDYPRDYSDLTVTEILVAPGNGAAITRFGSRPPAYRECRDRGDYGGALQWDPFVPTGTYVCIKIKSGQVGYVRLDYERDLMGKVAKTEVSGVIWLPVK